MPRCTSPAASLSSLLTSPEQERIRKRCPATNAGKLSHLPSRLRGLLGPPPRLTPSLTRSLDKLCPLASKRRHRILPGCGSAAGVARDKDSKLAEARHLTTLSPCSSAVCVCVSALPNKHELNIKSVCLKGRTELQILMNEPARWCRTPTPPPNMYMGQPVSYSYYRW